MTSSLKGDAAIGHLADFCHGYWVADVVKVAIPAVLSMVFGTLEKTLALFGHQCYVTYIFAVAFCLLSAGHAGFTFIKAGALGHKFEASRDGASTLATAATRERIEPHLSRGKISKVVPFESSNEP